MCPKMQPVGVTKKRKKDRNFHASNWLFAQITHVDVGPEIMYTGKCPGSSYISSFMKIRPGVSELWGVENRFLPLTRPMANTTACTTVPAVIILYRKKPHTVYPMLYKPTLKNSKIKCYKL